MKKGPSLVIISLACLTIATFAASTFGTMAWYAYSTRATMAYQGTAVRKTEQLQIGLLWDRARDATYESTYGVSYEEVGAHSYYFMPAGTGFSSAAINDYLVFFGHATNELPPVTSKTYAAGSDLSLFQSPHYLYAQNNTPAQQGQFVELPFAFRIETTSGGEPTLVRDQNIWLTDATASTNGTKDVKKSLRVHVNNPSGSDAAHQKYILNPTAEEEGVTYVAGALDLNGDGFYDFKSASTVEDPERMDEIIYGEYSTTRSMTKAVADTYDDINDTRAGSDNLSTFNAKHYGGVYGFTTDYTNVTRNTANYLSFEDVRPDESYGIFTGGYPIAKTSDDEYALGRTTLTVYLEGWDHSIIDVNIGAKFNLGLQFEINRV